LLLAVIFAQTITSIPLLSIAWDEQGHIAFGYSILRTGEIRLIDEHPPLTQLWMSWPLLLSSRFPDPRQLPAWQTRALHGTQGFTSHEAWWSVPIDSWLVPPRILVSLLALLLGAFLFRWASDWFGPRAGLAALALFAFDPNILAHATVATIDLGVTCFIFIAMYTLQRFLRRPSPTWVAQCAAPIAPLEPDQVAEGFGQADLRLAFFDCSTSWLYPTGGQSPGWVALPLDAPAWARPYLAPLRLSYERKRDKFSPPFRLYEDDGRMVYPRGGRARVAPSAMSLAEAVSSAPIDLPLSFDGLTLLGFTLDRPTLKPGETVYLETAWRVENVPGRLLSVMAHALGPDGRVVATGDGLGAPIESWQVGDVFVQRHALTLPSDAPSGPYWIQTGVYWLDNGERWPARDNRAAGDRLLLEPVEVKR